MRITLQALLLGLLPLLFFNFRGEATLKYKKQTGKKCIFCHTEVPEPGDEDPQLNEEGEKFERNRYRLTEEQKELKGNALRNIGP